MKVMLSILIVFSAACVETEPKTEAENGGQAWSVADGKADSYSEPTEDICAVEGPTGCDNIGLECCNDSGLRCQEYTMKKAGLRNIQMTRR